MIDGIKERFQIAIDNPFPSPLFRFSLNGTDRVVGTACRTKSITVFAENRFVDRCQDLGYRLLDDAVQNRRDAQRSFRAI